MLACFTCAASPAAGRPPFAGAAGENKRLFSCGLAPPKPRRTRHSKSHKAAVLVPAALGTMQARRSGTGTARAAQAGSPYTVVRTVGGRSNPFVLPLPFTVRRWRREGGRRGGQRAGPRGQVPGWQGRGGRARMLPLPPPQVCHRVAGRRRKRKGREGERGGMRPPAFASVTGA